MIYKRVRAKVLHTKAQVSASKSKRHRSFRKTLLLPILCPIDEEKESMVFDDDYLFDYCVIMPNTNGNSNSNSNNCYNHKNESTIATVAVTIILLMALFMVLAARIGTPTGIIQFLPDFMPSPFDFRTNLHPSILEFHRFLKCVDPWNTLLHNTCTQSRTQSYNTIHHSRSLATQRLRTKQCNPTIDPSILEGTNRPANIINKQPSSQHYQQPTNLPSSHTSRPSLRLAHPFYTQ